MRDTRGEAAYTALLESLSETSVNRVHRTLKNALRHAVKLGLIGYNPIERVTAPRPPRREMRPLTPDEVEIFLDSTRTDRLHALWALLVTTGLRIGEATGLHWQDLDLDGRALHVRDTVKRVKGKGLVVGDTKTPHSRRRIELARSTVNALGAHQKQQEWERRIAGEAWMERDLVFCTLIGGPFDAGSISHAKDRALERATCRTCGRMICDIRLPHTS